MFGSYLKNSIERLGSKENGWLHINHLEVFLVRNKKPMGSSLVQ